MCEERYARSGHAGEVAKAVNEWERDQNEHHHFLAVTVLLKNG